MGRVKERYSVIKRPGSPCWYYKTESMSGYKTTGLLIKEVRKLEAEAWARLRWQEESARIEPGQRLFDWAYPFFTKDCPRLTRFKEEGRYVSPLYIKHVRYYIEKNILPDPLSQKPIHEIRKSDVLAFRSRLISRRGSTAPAQKTMSVLGVIFSEAEYRELIDRNPCYKISQIKVQERQAGIFSQDEIRALFSDAPGPWKSLEAYTCFFLVAGTGMRRNEALALRWCDISPDGLIRIERQFLGDSSDISAPKCQKTRMSEVPSRVLEALSAWRVATHFQADDDLLFCDSFGYRRRNKWWSYHFHCAVCASGIDPAKRGLKPHSFRHTLNTRLRASGKLSDKKIRDALGWSAEAMQDGYTHQDRDAVAGIGQVANEVF
jgi:integrase